MVVIQTCPRARDRGRSVTTGPLAVRSGAARMSLKSILKFFLRSLDFWIWPVRMALNTRLEGEGDPPVSEGLSLRVQQATHTISA